MRNSNFNKQVSVILRLLLSKQTVDAFQFKANKIELYVGKMHQTGV